MCIMWFEKFTSPNIENLTLVFPVTGHSSSYPDMVFKHIVHCIKKLDCIFKTEELLNIIKKFAEVFYFQEL